MAKSIDVRNDGTEYAERAVHACGGGADHWRSGADAGGERRAEIDIAVDEEFYHAARAEQLNVRSHGFQKTPRNNRVPELFFSILFDLAAFREKYRARTLSLL